MEILENIVLVLLIATSIIMTVAIAALPPKGQGIGSIGGETGFFGRKKQYGKAAMIEKVVDYSAIAFMVLAFLYTLLLKIG